MHCHLSIVTTCWRYGLHLVHHLFPQFRLHQFWGVSTKKGLNWDWIWRYKVHIKFQFDILVLLKWQTPISDLSFKFHENDTARRAKWWALFWSQTQLSLQVMLRFHFHFILYFLFHFMLRFHFHFMLRANMSIKPVALTCLVCNQANFIKHMTNKKLYKILEV